MEAPAEKSFAANGRPKPRSASGLDSARSGRHHGDMGNFACREGCGACCIAPSINSPLPGRKDGKPAGEVCPWLDATMRCGLWGRPGRPAFCSSLAPDPEMCGSAREEALARLAELERLTDPRR